MRSNAGRQRRVRSVLVAMAIVTYALVGTGMAAGANVGTSTRCTNGTRAASGGDDICIARGNATATQLLDAVREVDQSQPIQGLVFGVWIDGKEVLTGAMGEQVAGVATTRDVHFRLGNTGETMMTTLLLRLVDQGKIKLDDPVSKWYPDLPEAGR